MQKTREEFEQMQKKNNEKLQPAINEEIKLEPTGTLFD